LEWWIDGTNSRSLCGFNNPAIHYSITPFRNWWVASDSHRVLAG